MVSMVTIWTDNAEEIHGKETVFGMSMNYEAENKAALYNLF